jgi:hypothetical protein
MRFEARERWLRRLPEIPAALVSFALFRATRAAMNCVLSVLAHWRRRDVLQWQLLSAAALESPLRMLIYMTRAPRWNTHALIATLGPCTVRAAMSLHAAQAHRSADSWSLVVYRAPYTAVHATDSLATLASGDWFDIALPPGRYVAVMRYYGPRSRWRVPAVRIDGRDAVASSASGPTQVDLCDALTARSGGVFRLLHHYMFTALFFRAWLSPRWLAAEFLPVGDPGNEFRYDIVERGKPLELDLAPEMVERNDVYLTVYDRASLPRMSRRMHAGRYRSERMPFDGFYLLRLRPRAPQRDAGSYGAESARRRELEEVG